MKLTRLLPRLLAFSLLASLAAAQTATWLGQNPPDPNRYSLWTDGTNWSTGTAPNGSTAIARLNQATYSPGGVLTYDNLQILNTDITLDGLQYGLFAPYVYPYTTLTVPRITVGGTAFTDYGTLAFVGSGITSPNVTGPYLPAPLIFLRNGTLVFSNNAAVAVSTSVDALNGTNQVWFRDTSSTNNLSLLLGSSARLDVANQARFHNSSVNFQGGHVSFTNQSVFEYSSISISGSGFISFGDQTTVLSPSFYFNRPAPGTDSFIRFSGQVYVQGGQANGNSSGAIEFTDQADANGFNLFGVRLLDVTGATTGTGTTGRQWSASGPLPTTSVVANDARTIHLGYVNVTDLILGSTSIQVNGGNLTLIRDTGGAHLSASGANLTGGGVIQNGYNTLYLNATNDPSPYAVPLTINAGNVYTYRQKLGPVTVNPGGYLGLYAGSATSLVNSGIVYVPTPTYQITGNYTQTSTGTLSGSAPFSNTTPLLLVTGQASLAGTLTGYNTGNFVGTHRVPILRAGSITGTFTSAPNLNYSPMLSVGVEYTPTEVAYVYTQRPFAKAGATPSQQLLGAHLDATLANASGAYYSLILNLNTMQDPALIAAGLGELAPDRYGVLNEQGFATATARQAALDRRLAGLRSAPAATPGFTTFLESGQLQNKFAALDGLPEVAMRSSGGLAGVAWRQARWTVGATVAKDRTRAALDGLGSTTRFTSTTGGLFGQYDAGRWFVQAAASRSDDDYTLVRDSGIGYRPSRVQATVNGHRTDLSLTAGTTFTGKDWGFTPYAGLLSSRVRLDDFAETRFSGNAATELAFKNWSVRSLRTRAGFDLTTLAAHGRVTPRLSVAWLHELKKDRGFTAGLIATNGVFYTAPGRPAETDLIQASFGIDWRISRQLSFAVNAGLARGRNSDTTSDLSAGFRWEF